MQYNETYEEFGERMTWSSTEELEVALTRAATFADPVMMRIALECAPSLPSADALRNALEEAIKAECAETVGVLLRAGAAPSTQELCRARYDALWLAADRRFVILIRFVLACYFYYCFVAHILTIQIQETIGILVIAMMTRTTWLAWTLGKSRASLSRASSTRISRACRWRALAPA